MRRTPLTAAEKQARVADLRARSAVYHPVDFECAQMQETRPARGSYPPGTFWFYSNWDARQYVSIYFT